jgi:hypothetical protein
MAWGGSGRLTPSARPNPPWCAATGRSRVTERDHLSVHLGAKSRPRSAAIITGPVLAPTEPAHLPKAATILMITWRRLVPWASVVSVALLVSGAPAFGAAPSTVPPTDPPTTSPAPAPADQTAPTDPGVIEESWALSPASSLEADAAGLRPELSYISEPGAVLEDAVTVANYGNVQLTFHIYATDAFNNDEGQFDLLPGDQEPTDVGSWVTFPQDLVTVPPGQQVTLPITIKIPADAAPGDHSGAILASNESTGTGDTGQAVTLDRRTGTRLYLRVGGDLFSELAVADVNTTYHHALDPFSGSADVTYRVENRGNTRLGGTATLSIEGPFGLGEQKVTLADVPELLPGEDIQVTVSVDDVPALMLDTSSITIEPVGGADDGALSASSGEDRTFAPPLTIMFLLLFLLFGILAWRSIRRHRNPAPVGNHPQSQLEREHQLT